MKRAENKTAVVQHRLAADPLHLPNPGGAFRVGRSRPQVRAKGRLQSVSTWIQRSAGPFVDSVAVPACMNSHGTRRDHTRTANMNTVALAEERKTEIIQRAFHPRQSSISRLPGSKAYWPVVSLISPIEETGRGPGTRSVTPVRLDKQVKTVRDSSSRASGVRISVSTKRMPDCPKAIRRGQET
jgi:hypothetical protein